MILVTVLRVGYARCAPDGSYRADGTVTLIRQYPSSASSSSPPVSELPSPHFTVLVDTGSPFDGPALLRTLATLDVGVEDIDAVVCTHGHVDHVGNLNLFGKSVFYLGSDKLTPEDVYETIAFEERLTLTVSAQFGSADGVFEIVGNALPLSADGGVNHRDRTGADHLILLKTPGHTESDLSVVVVGAALSLTCFDCAAACQTGEFCSSCDGLRSEEGVDLRRHSRCVVVAGDLFEDEYDEGDDGAAWKGNSWNREIQAGNRNYVRQMADVIVPGHGRPFKGGTQKLKKSDVETR